MEKGISNCGSYAFDDSELLKSVTTIESWTYSKKTWKKNYTFSKFFVIIHHQKFLTLSLYRRASDSKGQSISFDVLQVQSY